MRNWGHDGVGLLSLHHLYEATGRENLMGTFTPDPEVSLDTRPTAHATLLFKHLSIARYSELQVAPALLIFMCK